MNQIGPESPPPVGYFAGDLASFKCLAVEIERAQAAEELVSEANRNAFAVFAVQTTERLGAGTRADEIQQMFREFRATEIKRLTRAAFAPGSLRSRLRYAGLAAELQKARWAGQIHAVPGAMLALRFVRFALVLGLMLLAIRILFTAGLVQILLLTFA